MLKVFRIYHILFLLVFCPIKGFSKDITVGSKAFTESMILSEMIAVLLEEKYDLQVSRKLNLGGTNVVFNAITNGNIDIYPEYTGTAYLSILKQNKRLSALETYDFVQERFSKNYNIMWSKPLGFNNTYTLAMRSDDSKFKNVSQISEIADLTPTLTLASPHEFLERNDGFPNFSKFYQLKFQDDKIKAMNSGLTYSALLNNKVDLIVSYSTDGRIKAYDLKTLEDDKKFFPVYEAAFLIRKETLTNYPQVKEAFGLLEGSLSEKEMIKLNDISDRLKVSPKVIARNWLISQGFIDGELDLQKNKPQSFFQFLKSKKNYLLKITKEHLLLSFGSLFIAILFSVPFGILISKNATLKNVSFPVINTVQTIPSLALLGFLIPLLGIGVVPAIVALVLYSILPIVRNTYTGISRVDKQYIEVSKGVGLTSWQILFYVEIPLALPTIIAGIRTSVVIVIGTATLSALIGAGGLGDPIFRGVSTLNHQLILLGAIPSALLAIFADRFINLIEARVVSKGIKNEG